MEDFEFSTEILLGYVYTYGFKLVAAVLTLIVGLWISNVVVNVVRRIMIKSKVDPSLQSFLCSLVAILIKIMVYITALGVLGIEMTSFIAMLGAAGLAIGLALSGTLQNFAGGVMILFFKTFKVGDFIEAQGHSGTVREIQIFVTILTTPDNKTVIMPNGPLATDTLINYTTQATRRVEWTFSIGYGDDIDTAYALLKELAEADERILKTPAPLYALNALADSSVNILMQTWVKAADYGPVFFGMNEQVYKRFPAAGLHIPFPQRDVHMYQEN